jgi:hypothetical protein
LATILNDHLAPAHLLPQLALGAVSFDQIVAV